MASLEGPVATLTAGERRGTSRRLAGLDDVAPTPELIAQRLVIRERPLLIGRQSIRAETPLGKPRKLVRKANRGAKGLAARHQSVRYAHPERFVPVDAAARKDQIHGVTVTDKTRKPNGTEIEQGHTESATEHSEDGIIGGDTHVAPERQLETAGNRVALDGRDHRLAEEHAGWPERPRAILDESPALTRGDGLKVGAGTEGPLRSGEHSHPCAVVVVILLESAEEGLRGGNVDSVAHLGAVDSDHQDIVITIGENSFHADPIWAP